MTSAALQPVVVEPDVPPVVEPAGDPGPLDPAAEPVPLHPVVEPRPLPPAAARPGLQRNPDAAQVRLLLTVREAVLPYDLICLATATGTRVTLTATIAASEGQAAIVVTGATCKLYNGLRDVCRGGL